MLFFQVLRVRKWLINRCVNVYHFLFQIKKGAMAQNECLSQAPFKKMEHLLYGKK